MPELSSRLDNRSTPRVGFSSQFTILPNINGHLIDLNYKGLSFLVADEIPMECMTISLKLFSKKLDLNIKPHWKRRTDKPEEYIYGASILDSNNEVFMQILKYMILTKFKDVTKNIKDRKVRKEVLFFSKKVRDYIFKLEELSNLIQSNNYSSEQVLSQLSLGTDEIVSLGDNLRSKINDKNLFNRIKKEFRSLASPWAYKSTIVKHSYDKPRGYPGDYETLEVIYDKKIITKKKNIGYFFDLYFLKNPYAEAVRNRKDMLKIDIYNYVNKKNNAIKILNLASGSCREIRELINKAGDNFINKEILFSCLDWDIESLNFSENQLKNSPHNIKIEFIREDILNYIKNRDFFEKKGQYDFIYSIGLADYLPDRVIKKLIKTSFDGLRSDGVFVLAHKDREKVFSHLPPEWFCDWVFIPRNQSETLALFESIGLVGYEYEIRRDQSGDIFFIYLKKNGIVSPNPTQNGHSTFKTSHNLMNDGQTAGVVS